VSHSLE
jgi:hypothetical protein